MDGMPLSLSVMLLGLLVVLLVLVVVLMIVRRRRADASGSAAAPVLQEWDGTQSLGDGVVSPEQRRLIESVLSSGGGSHGRHAAVPAEPSGVLMLLVPVSGKRRNRRVDVAPRLVTMSSDSIEDVPMMDAEIDREPQPAVIAVPARTEIEVEADSPRGDALAAHDLRAYQQRVATTIQAIGQRIGPGESPEVVERRMLAAVERLDGPLGFVRPTLSPAGPDHTFGRLASPGRVAEPLAQAAPPAPPAPSAPQAPPAPSAPSVDSVPPPTPDPVEAAPPPPGEFVPWVDDHALGGDPFEAVAPEETPLDDLRYDETEPVLPVTPPVDEPEVVLPVPPLARPEPVRRRGFRPRGKAG